MVEQDSSLYTEEELKKAMAGNSYPKVTPQFLESLIEDVKYDVLSDGKTTVCTIILLSGLFSVRGESSIVDPQGFDAKTGRTYAYKAAMNNMWPAAGAILAHALHLRNQGSHMHVLALAQKFVAEQISVFDRREGPIPISDVRSLLYTLETFLLTEAQVKEADNAD